MPDYQVIYKGLFTGMYYTSHIQSSSDRAVYQRALRRASSWFHGSSIVAIFRVLRPSTIPHDLYSSGGMSPPSIILPAAWDVRGIEVDIRGEVGTSVRGAVVENTKARKVRRKVSTSIYKQ